MANPPDKGGRNVYYWYYATQVMHNMAGPEWDTWNRKMRRVLIDSQDKEGCAAGSWDPDEADQRRLGRRGRPGDDDQPGGADAGGLLPLPAAVQARQGRGCRSDPGGTLPRERQSPPRQNLPRRRRPSGT